ncbi:hypothetical protein BDW42DRAFT_176511 [Aspergillus taichungensis]|uniref:Uncharacterized protein n=1 Tax=Aspergillus taichungensis TaxID=482145 RepID=A0A2J5HKD3_9EURO|nr:hypothetical protein BDW42DRAFT_176511 [Aspergillus taichungensis]
MLLRFMNNGLRPPLPPPNFSFAFFFPIPISFHFIIALLDLLIFVAQKLISTALDFIQTCFRFSDKIQ